MKANELMIFDLVRRKKDNRTMIVVEVGYDENIGAITTDDRFYGDFEDYHETQVEPIPITPEILEKNGFKYDGSGQRSMMLMTPHGVSGTRWNIYVGLKHKTIDVFSAPPVEKTPGWRKHNKVYLEVCGWYVHELQHALRLCGIDKEIVL